MARRMIPAAFIAAGLLVSISQPAYAGLFDDDVARKQVSELQRSTSQMLTDQARLMDKMNSDVAELRGQLELLINQVGLLEKRQKDFYLDLDNRVQILETTRLKIPASKPTASHSATTVETRLITTIPPTVPEPKLEPQAPAADPSAASKAYEAALDLFKTGKYKEAAAAFDQLGQNYPSSEQAPAAQYWLGNSYYALGDCKQVINSQQKLLSTWPNSNRAPDAMLHIANCQAETGAKLESQKTLRELIAKYPDTKAATTARQQVK